MVMDIKDLDRINLLYSKVRIIEEDISWLHKLANQVNKESAEVLSLSLKHSFCSDNKKNLLTQDGSLNSYDESVFKWLSVDRTSYGSITPPKDPNVTETDFNLNDVEIYFVLSSLLHIKRNRRDELIKQLNELL